ncbi:hypothetical protein ACLK17_13805 [Escherichia coli]
MLVATSLLIRQFCRHHRRCWSATIAQNGSYVRQGRSQGANRRQSR